MAMRLMTTSGSLRRQMSGPRVAGLPQAPRNRAPQAGDGQFSSANSQRCRTVLRLPQLQGRGLLVLMGSGQGRIGHRWLAGLSHSPFCVFGRLEG